VATPESCTTSSVTRLHCSVDLTAGVTHKVGRAGRTLCQYEAVDEAEANRHAGTIWGPRIPIAITDLPVCKRCEKAAARLEVS
jgi:hypothetical protein